MSDNEMDGIQEYVITCTSCKWRAYGGTMAQAEERLRKHSRAEHSQEVHDEPGELVPVATVSTSKVVTFTLSGVAPDAFEARAWARMADVIAAAGKAGLTIEVAEVLKEERP